MKIFFRKMIFYIFLFSFKPGFAQPEFKFDKYHTPKEVGGMLEGIQQQAPGKTRLHTLTNSPGKHPVTVLEIGSNQQNVPAIFVGANFEGNIPLATEGALRLAKMLIGPADYTAGLKWYIMPQPNPDAAMGFFSETRYERKVNQFSINNDVDESTDEDGFEDLNGDGWITQMRVKAANGTHVPHEKDARIMRPADPRKGERGIYKIYSEGIDNDNDGHYNEDGEGGINVGIAFPHLFPEEKMEAGQWAGQTPEVYHILRFMYDRPEIAMVFTLGSSNFCLSPPKSDRKGGSDPDKIKIPAAYAKRFGVDPSNTFTVEEIKKMWKEKIPDGSDISAAQIARMFGPGEVVNPLEDDLKFYREFAEDYKAFLKAKNFSIENLPPAPAKNGSFELWAYYQLGVPSFSMNLFSVPLVEEKENGIHDGNDKDKMNNRADDNGSDARERPEEISKKENNEDKTGKDTNDLSLKIKSLLAWSDAEWNGKGFAEWEKVTHPDFKEAETGGFVPYLETTPKPGRIDSLLNVQLPWLLRLSQKLPEISVSEVNWTDLGEGIYKMELFLENNGDLPYPTAMGCLNRQPSPVVILLDGDFELLEGIKRTPAGCLGRKQAKKLTWLIKAGKGATMDITLESAVFGTSSKQFKIGG